MERVHDIILLMKMQRKTITSGNDKASMKRS